MAVVHPDLSAVIPTFNRERLIGRAIESVLAQSVRPSEIIVVDDGSTDSTEDIVAGYAGVRYVAQTNGGPALARNRGVAEASTNWIAWLDSDDFWLPGHIERIMSAVDATGGGARFYFADLIRPVDGVPTSHWSRCDFGIEGQFELVDDAADWVLLPRRPVMMQASVIRPRGVRERGRDLAAPTDERRRTSLHPARCRPQRVRCGGHRGRDDR